MTASLPHQFPANVPDGDLVAWRCRACGELVSEYKRGSSYGCSVDWRADISKDDVMTPMPNQPRTPLKSFRIPQDLYVRAQVKAAERGESVSDVVRRALERYVKRA